MTHHLRQDFVEVVHHLFRRHRHVVLTIEVDGDVDSALPIGGIVAKGCHSREMAAGRHAERRNSCRIYPEQRSVGANMSQRFLNVLYLCRPGTPGLAR